MATQTLPKAQPAPRASITREEIDEAVKVFWPRFSTREIADIYGWHESHVANALARVQDKGSFVTAASRACTHTREG